MLFPNTFTRDVKRYGKRFVLRNILSIPPDIGGVYIFHYNHNFVYVGQSARSEGLSKRLNRHYNGSHNKELATWFKAFDGDLHFTHISCCDVQIDDLERSLIRHLQPITNKLLYRDYRPLPLDWRKTNG